MTSDDELIDALRPVSDAAVVVIDRNRVIRHFSPLAEKLYGVDAADVLGRSDTILSPPDLLEVHHEFLGRVLAGHETPETMLDRTDADGTERYVLIRGWPLCAPDGRVIGGVVYLRDVTETRLAERDRDRAREQFLRAFEYGLLPMGIIGADQRYVRINEAFRRMLGLATDEAVLGATAEWFTHPADWAEDAALLARLAAGEAPSYARQKRYRHADGHWIWAEVNVAIIPLPETGEHEFVIQVRDVTELRWAHQRLAAEHRRLVASQAIGHVGTFETDLETGVMAWSSEMLRIHLRDPDTDPISDWRELLDDVHPDDRGPLRDEPSDKRADFDYVYRVVRDPENIRYVEVRSGWAPGEEESHPGFRLGTVRDVTETTMNAERLRHLADHDPMTGLLNRRAFDAALQRHVDQTRAGRRTARGTLLMIDLDHFKEHNDTHGHPVGDRIIVGAAHCLTARLRETDVIGRLGGDEFIALLPDVLPDEAGRIAEDLVALISEMGRETLPEQVVGVTASIGITGFQDRPDLETVLRRVDAALYAAKETGRNRWVRSD